MTHEELLAYAERWTMCEVHIANGYWRCWLNWNPRMRNFHVAVAGDKKYGGGDASVALCADDIAQIATYQGRTHIVLK